MGTLLSRHSGADNFLMRTLWTFAFAAAVAITFTVCDYLLLNDIIPNRGPRLTGYDLIKTAVAVGLAVALVSSIYADGRSQRRVETPDVARPGPVILNLALATAFVLLFVVSPQGSTGWARRTTSSSTCPRSLVWRGQPSSPASPSRPATCLARP
jgi:hypothetical protein